jgi:hypothetical protein
VRQARSLAGKRVRETPGAPGGAQAQVLALRLGPGAYALRVTGPPSAGELLERELSALVEGGVRHVFVDLGAFEMEPVTAAALESAQAELRGRGGDLVVVADGPA